VQAVLPGTPGVVLPGVLGVVLPGCPGVVLPGFPGVGPGVAGMPGVWAAAVPARTRPVATMASDGFHLMCGLL
jgi:hypothetical protein